MKELRDTTKYIRVNYYVTQVFLSKHVYLWTMFPKAKVQTAGGNLFAPRLGEKSASSGFWPDDRPNRKSKSASVRNADSFDVTSGARCTTGEPEKVFAGTRAHV